MIVAKHIVVTVAAAGTRVPVIASSKLVVGSVSFLPIVTTSAFVGMDTVSSSTYGLKLLAAQTTPTVMQLGDGVLDLATVYIDATTNGDKVAVLYFEKVGR